MFLAPNRSRDVTQHDSSCCVGDECLDDITADLVSLTLSDPDSSSLNVYMKNLSFQSTPKTNSGDSHVHATKETPPESLLVILNSNSEDNAVFSNTEMLTQYCGEQISETCDISIQNVVRDSKTLHNKNEQFVSSPLEHAASEQNTKAENMFGFAQSDNRRDKNTLFDKYKLSVSLHDVSRLTDFPLKCKSRDLSSDTIQSRSVTTISSGLKSKDSGLPRSVSCFSLNSGGKSYEHVQSKVKEYIRHIKEADERRKSLKLGDISSNSINAGDLSYVSDDNKSAASEKTLTSVIRGLRNEIQEREMVYAKLQDNYNKLLVKYAEAENRIDHLRFKVAEPSVKLASQKEDHHVPGAEKSVYKRISDMRADAKLLPFDVKCESNDEIPTYKKVQSSVAQFAEGKRHNLTLNSVVRPYSSSLRLDKRFKSLPNNSKAKTIVESFKSELSDITGGSKGRLSSERPYRRSVTQSNNMFVTDDHISSAASSYQKSVCQGVESVTAQGGESCEDVCQSGLSQSRRCKTMPVASSVKGPEYTSYCNETLLCKKSLEQSEANKPCSSFEKVSRWQESLPPFELIEPKCYESLECHNSGSKTSSPNFIKKFVSSGGRDSGCPCSELYSSAVCLNSVRLSSLQAPKCKNDLIGTKDLSLITEPQMIAQPTHHRVAFPSSPYSSTISGDGRMLDNDGKFNLPVSISYDVKLSECSQNTVVSKLLNIDSCECWNPVLELPGDSKETNVKLKPCDQKPNNTFQDFYVPPLKLGSLLGGDDSSENVAQSIYSSGVTAVSETEEISKAGLYSSVYQATSEDITYPSSTYMTSDSHACEALNTVKFTSLEACPSSSVASGLSNQQQCNYSVLKTYGKESKRKQYNNVQSPKDSVVESRMNNYTSQSGSLHTSVTASTSYRSIQPYKPVKEVEFVATQQHAGELTQVAQTNDHGILNDIHAKQDDCQSSIHAAVGAVKLAVSRRKLLGAALRYHLLEFLNAENYVCSDCICHRPSKKPMPQRNNIHHTSVKNKNIEVESGGTNISYVGTRVKLTSKMSDMECGTADRVVSSAVEAANQEDLNCNSGRVTDVDYTVIPEEVKHNLMKHLHELDHYAQQLKARSETILNALAVQLKPVCE